MSTEFWIDGQPKVPDAALYRGWSYGDGVFRTLLRNESQTIDKQGQICHFVADALALGLQPPAAGTLGGWLRHAAGDTATCCLKLTAVRAASARGYRWASSQTRVLIERSAAPRLDARCVNDGIAVDLAAPRCAWRDAGCGAKHLNRLDNVMASADWPDGIDERLMRDRDDRLIGGTRSNLFWVSSGHVRTPIIEHSGVRGRMRARVIALCAELGLPLREVSTGVDALHAADEAFVTNSLIGIWPLRTFGPRRWQAPGPLTRQLIERLAHPVIG